MRTCPYERFAIPLNVREVLFLEMEKNVSIRGSLLLPATCDKHVPICRSIGSPGHMLTLLHFSLPVHSSFLALASIQINAVFHGDSVRNAVELNLEHMSSFPSLWSACREGHAQLQT